MTAHPAHLVLPMAGRGSRFAQDGVLEPKPLVPLHGRPFFFWAIRSVLQHLPDCRLSVVVLQEHQDRWGLADRVREAFPQAELHLLPAVSRGALDTALGALDAGDGAPVLINDCDHALRFSALPGLVEALRSGAAAGTLAHFPASTPHFSYARYGADGLLEETAEKQVISRHAIAGLYGFANANLLRAAAARYTADLPYAETFISGVYNTLVADGLPVRGADLDWHIPFGTPEEWRRAQTQPAPFRTLLP